MTPQHPLPKVVCLPTVALATLVCAGCATQAPPRTERVRPDLMLVPWDQVALWDRVCRDFPTTGTPTQGVVRPPHISATQVARYQDPNDPDLLHERHLVYRRETGPAWELHGETTARTPPPRDGRQELQPLQLQEVAQRLAAQELERVALREAVSALVDAVRKLQASAAQAPSPPGNSSGGEPTSDGRSEG